MRFGQKRLAMLAGVNLAAMCWVAACGGAAGRTAPAAPAAPAAAAAPATQSRPKSLPKFTLAYALSGASAPFWVAEATGAFVRNGVDVKLVNIGGGANDSAALIAKGVDGIMEGAPPVLSVDLRSNVKVVIVGTVLNHANSSFFVQPNVRSASQLRGARIANDRPGTPIAYQVHLALQHFGLSSREVTQLQMSSQSMLPALESHQIQGSLLFPPQTFVASTQGFRDLYDLYGESFVSTSLIVLQSRLRQLAPAIEGVLRGVRAGVNSYNTDPKLAEAVLGKYLHITNQTDLQETYALYRNRIPFNASLQPSMRGIQNMLQFLSATIPAAKNASPQQFIDMSYVKAVNATK